MIQLAALPAQIATATAPGTPDGSAETAGNSAFADMLAQLQPLASEPGKADPALAGAQEAAAKTATLAAMTGKILPPVAAGIAATVAGLNGGESAPGQDAAPPAGGKPAHPAPLIPALIASIKAARTAPAAAATDAPTDAAAPAESADDAAEQAPALATITPSDAGSAALALLGVSELPLAPAHEAAAAPETNPAPSATALPRMIAAQMQGQPLRPEMVAAAKAAAASVQAPEQPTPADAAQVRLLPVAALGQDMGRAAAFTMEGAAPAPAAAVATLRPQLAGAERPTAAADPLMQGATELSLAPQTSAQPAPTAAPATTTAAPLSGPQDFAALVDRLIAARDAARPEGINVAVQHAEFGPVSLHFRHDEGGLSVSVANADPEFAAAMQAALPPVSASAESSRSGQQDSAGQSAARQDMGRNDMARNDSAGQQQRGQTQAQPAAADSRRAGGSTGAETGEQLAADAPARGRGRFA